MAERSGEGPGGMSGGVRAAEPSQVEACAVAGEEFADPWGRSWIAVGAACACAFVAFVCVAALVMHAPSRLPESRPAPRRVSQVYVPPAKPAPAPVRETPSPVAEERPAPPPDPRPAKPPLDPGPPPARPPPASPPPRTPDPWQVAQAAVPPPAPEPPAAAAPARKDPSAAAFSEKIQPILDALCMSCHGKPGLPVGGLVLTPPGKSGHGAVSRRNNLKAVTPFTRPDAPSLSPLVLKPLALADGGIEHGGGDNFRRDSLEYAALVAFAGGAEPSEIRPLANAGPDQDLELGRLAKFDGVASRDAGGRRLQWAWTVAVAPAGAVARPANADGREATLKPDAAGTWVLELVVTDPSRARSLPSRVRLRVRTPSDPPPAPPAPRLARFKSLVPRLLAHDPGPAAVSRLAALSPEAFADDLLADARFWEGMLARDLAWVGLEGTWAPAGEGTALAGARLANGDGDVVPEWKRWLADPAVGRRYPDAAAARAFLAARLAGENAGDTAAEDLPGRESFRRIWLERHSRAIAGKAPSARDVGAWSEAWGTGPGLRTVLRAWLAALAS